MQTRQRRINYADIVGATERKEKPRRNVKDIIKSTFSNQELKEIFKTPPKEINKPKTLAFDKDDVHQADILFFTEDNGFKYILTVVDVYSRKIDAYPLKTKSSKVVKNALVEIWNRGILRQPYKLTVDDGSEFKGEVERYCNQNDILMKVAETGRSRQVALAEKANGRIAKALNLVQAYLEQQEDVENTEWVDFLDEIVSELNKKAKGLDKQKISDDIVVKKDKILLNEGDVVRYKLDKPEAFIDGQKLPGNFRATDMRYSRTKHEIEKVLFTPGQVPLYILEDKPKTGFTKEQLLMSRN